MQKNTNLQLSIILPIYNVEKFLKKCILSLENQDIPKDSYEIICVIDGSPDNSKQIILDLQKEYSNIILIDQENQGVSMARNNGITIAKGTFLFFVDPDDAIKENSLKNLIEYARSNYLQIVYSPLTFVEMDGKIKETKFEFNVDKVINGIDLYYSIRKKGTKDPDRSYGVLYSRELIYENSLFYLKDVPYLEDGEFITRVFCLTERSSIYNTPYYLRLNRPGSATHSNLFNKKNTLKGFIKAANNLKSFKNTNNLTERQIGLINGRIIKFVILTLPTSIINIKNIIWAKHELKKNRLLKLDLKNVNGYYYNLGRELNISIYWFYSKRIFTNLIRSIKNRINKFTKN